MNGRNWRALELNPDHTEGCWLYGRPARSGARASRRCPRLDCLRADSGLDERLAAVGLAAAAERARRFAERL
jgi:hypothetical protein